MSISANFPNVFPSLELNFAQGQQLDPRVTFSRSTTAPYYDGKTSVLAEQNLLLQSQSFNTTWSNTGVASISTTATTAPDGTSTGNSITEDTSTGTHRFNQTVTTLASTSYVFSIELKYSNCQYVSLINSPVNNSATFDLVNGTVTTSSGTVSNFITNIGNGWYRVGYVVNNLNAGSTQFFVQMMDSTGTTNNYTGTSRLIYAWGAQLEQRSSVTAYNATTTSAITNYIPQLLTAPINAPRFDFNPTTGESLGLLIEQSSTNLLTYSQDFSNAVYGKTNGTIATGVNIAPDGTQTVSSYTRTVTSGTESMLRVTTTQAVSSSYTLSVYGKVGTLNNLLYLRNLAVDNTLTTGVVRFNLTTATIDLTYGSTYTGKASITPVGNGIYRCSITGITPASITNNLIDIGGTSSSTVGGTTGDFLFLWGAQLEALAFPTSYIPTTSAQVTRAQDSALMTGTNFSNWWNYQQGTMFIDIASSSTTGNKFIGAFAYGADLSSFYATFNNDNTSEQIYTTGFVSRYNQNQGVANPPTKIALSYNVNTTTAIGTSNGATPITGTTVASFPTPTQLFIGWNQVGNQCGVGRIRKFAFYPIQFTSAQNQALTGS